MMSTVGLVPGRDPPIERTVPTNCWAVGGCAAAAGVTGTASAVVGPIAVVAAAGVGLVALAAWRPIIGTYVYLATLPFIAGIGRGAVLPLVRPNEAVLILVITGVCLGGYVRLVAGRSVSVRLRPLDLPLATFVLLATLWPIVSLMLRGNVPKTTDLAAVLPAIKLGGILLLVRTTVGTRAQLLRCVRLIVWTAAVIAAIAVLQTVRFAPVLALLEIWWSVGVDAEHLGNRGSTTLGHSIATGDYVLIGLVLLITCGIRGLITRRKGIVLGLVLGSGVLAAGQFSTWLAAVVAASYMFHRIPTVRRRAIRFLPTAGLAVVVGAPALLGRLQSVGGDLGVPQSWLVRWDNVTYLYVPRLMENLHLVTGVSPDSVLPAPDIWRDVIYIESGYLQLLWIGGLPLLAAFTWLSIGVLRRSRTLADRPDELGAAGSCLEIIWVVVIALSVLDPHVFLRGTGDLLFTLIGIATGKVDEENDAQNAPIP